ncbi:MAG: helix-hairpin-helix domain-containing protein [bacterium]|nr:helix-hairpin-helix domain-containing protein [bacterium]
MPTVIKQPTLFDKLSILSRDSQYDLACACGTNDYERRVRSRDDRWIYPVTTLAGRTTYLFKILLSNECVNDCKYCPLRAGMDPRRCRLKPEELVKVFFDYYREGKVSGLFLSSGVIGTPDRTMDLLIGTASMLRRRNFRGYIHLKILPGASDGAITQAVALANAVSLNIETAGEEHFRQLSKSKDYTNDIIRPIKLISSLTRKGSRYSHVKQTTQFVVGAAGESDREIVSYSWGLYRRLNFHRVYFSAYQRGLGDPALAGENSALTNAEMLTREHRLYQADWLMRKYGFKSEEIPFNSEGNLSLSRDPKETWALNNTDKFPVNVNKADKYELLRVPGFGEITVNRILALRSSGYRIKHMENIGKVNKLLKKAAAYVSF